MEMKSMDYLSNAELKPSINRLMGLFNSLLIERKPLDEVKTKAIIAILMDIDDKCDEACEEMESKQEAELMSMEAIQMPRML